MDPKANPYLAHMYDDTANGNGSVNKDNLLAGLTRHQTTAEQAKVAEDGPYNPFTGRQFSKRYLSILQTRRNLPVHAQRYDITARLSFQLSALLTNTQE